MYFDPATDQTPIRPFRDAHALISLNGLAVIVLGLFPGAVMTWCAQAIVRTLST